jgi:hypothetical protein
MIMIGIPDTYSSKPDTNRGLASPNSTCLGPLNAGNDAANSDIHTTISPK